MNNKAYEYVLHPGLEVFVLCVINLLGFIDMIKESIYVSVDQFLKSGSESGSTFFLWDGLIIV
jgi:hypothetical protein